MWKSITTAVGTRNQLSRDAWLEKTLAAIPKGSRILDAGAGERRCEKYCAHLEYVAQDFAQYDGVGDGKALQTSQWDQTRLDIVCDITNIPQPDGSFDAVMCVEVFQHLADPQFAIREFSRLLRPGGTLVLTAPFCSLTHFSPYHFSSGYNRYFYDTHLAKNGFQTLEITPNGNFFEYIAQEIRRIRYCARRYANSSPNFFEILAMVLVLRALSRFSSRDTSSSELLCYGFHVLARKEPL